MKRIAACLALAAAPASAGVVSVADTAAIVERGADVAVPPAKLWPLLLAPARWWSPAHSWSGDARNLSITARPGGCFCEALPGGGFVEHFRVVRVEPRAMLRMTGGLGPLQADALGGPLTITLAATGGGTRMTWRYAFAGAGRVPLPVLAPIVDAIIGEQVARLTALAEGRALPSANRPAASSQGTASQGSASQDAGSQRIGRPRN